MSDKYIFNPQRQNVFNTGVLIGGPGIQDDRSLSQQNFSSLMSTATRSVGQQPDGMQYSSSTQGEDIWPSFVPQMSTQSNGIVDNRNSQSELDACLTENADTYTTASAECLQPQQTSDAGEDDDDPLVKRKAQNRAAQRAFRERREKHVKELQDKLAQADARITSLQNENLRLTKELDWYMAESKVLKEAAIEAVTQHRNQNGKSPDAFNANVPVVFPTFAEIDEQRRQMQEFQKSRVNEVAFSSPAQIWDALKAHPRTENLDIEAVIKLLMNKVQCSEDGPVFLASDVEQAIEQALVGHDNTTT
ncbi:hypothetical protein V1512DRAFT_107568 [Lipomyces arxii]|uniref:uncharacterized protein n=1 Tax=Lipomyces arxii TaxID=56418 RepID=UPI0034CD4745